MRQLPLNFRIAKAEDSIRIKAYSNGIGYRQVLFAVRQAKLFVCSLLVNHHIEEESEIFPKVEKAKMDFEEIGSEIAERKAILTEE
jgi:hypothetical protein